MARATGFGTRASRTDEARWFASGDWLIGRAKQSRIDHLTGTMDATVPLDGPEYGVQIGNAAHRIHRVSFGLRVTLAVEVAVF